MARDYTTLITSQHAAAPKFVALVAFAAGVFGDATDAVSSLPAAFDLDFATGSQLDVVGEWVGLSRSITTPISGAFFSWGVEGLGWGEGYWLPPYAPTEGLTRLDDSTYRTMLRAKIVANHFDGTINSYQTALAYMFTDTGIQSWSIDHQDMSLEVRLWGTVSPVLITLLKSGTMPAKPAGVRLAVSTISALSTEADDGLLGLADENGNPLGLEPSSV